MLIEARWAGVSSVSPFHDASCVSLSSESDSDESEVALSTKEVLIEVERDVVADGIEKGAGGVVATEEVLEIFDTKDIAWEVFRDLAVAETCKETPGSRKVSRASGAGSIKAF